MTGRPEKRRAGVRSASPSDQKTPRRSDRAKSTPADSAMQSQGRVVSLVPALLPPPIPVECNLTGNTWFALPFEALRKWSPWRRGSDLMRSRTIMLFGAGYSATPAGSLPDDDDELAEAAGFGMDTEAWLAAKAEILGAWQLHSDGRWYCTFLTEIVLDAWGRVSDRRRKEAVRKANQRARTPGLGDVVGEEAVADVQGDNADVPRDTPSRPAGHRTTRQDRKKQSPLAPQGASSDLKDLKEWRGPPDVLWAVIASGKSEVWALTWLAKCEHHAGPPRELRAPGLAYDRLRMFCEAHLAHIGVELVEAKP
jgi:hypothetical protein